MGVIIYSFGLNIPPKMSYGVFECDIVMLENYMPMILSYKPRALLVPDPVFISELKKDLSEVPVWGLSP